MKARWIMCGTFALAVLIGGTARAAVDPKVVVGAWLLDDDDGVEVVDSSPNGFDGTLTGGDWVDGVYGGAIEFVKGDTVKIPLPANTVANKLTVMMWVRFTDRAGQQNYFSIWDGGDKRIVPYKTDANAIHFWTNTWNLFSGFTAPDDEWFHVANVYDGSVARIYIDGKLLMGDQAAPGMSLGAGEQNIWLATDKGSGFFSAVMLDDVLVLNDVIDADDVTQAKEQGIEYVLGLKPVESKGKAAVTWGRLKR
ncbi:MAG: LamG domain-containing protein [Candidatus Poribacteria bacterium]|nr:LamG domain-containing protein [Candidatus Poribacteria bacterium]